MILLEYSKNTINNDETYEKLSIINNFRGLYDDLQDIMGGPALSLLGVSTKFFHQS